MTDDDKARLAEMLARAIDSLQAAIDLLVHGGPEPEAEHCRHCPHCRQQDYAEAGGALPPMRGGANDTPSASNLINPSPSKVTA